MKVSKVSLERTFNMGNYESLRVGFEASDTEQDNPLNVLRGLEDMAELYLQSRLAKAEKPKAETKPKLPKVDVTNLQWEVVQTDNPFEITKQQDAESFKLLKAKIDEKQGKPIYVDGYLYWMMRDGVTLARRGK